MDYFKFGFKIEDKCHSKFYNDRSCEDLNEMLEEKNNDFEHDIYQEKILLRKNYSKIYRDIQDMEDEKDN